MPSAGTSFGCSGVCGCGGVVAAGCVAGDGSAGLVGAGGVGWVDDVGSAALCAAGGVGGAGCDRWPGAPGAPAWVIKGAATPDGVGTSVGLGARVSLPFKYGVLPSLPVGFSGFAATVDLSE